MMSTRMYSVAVLLAGSVASLGAQEVLRPSPSTRATSEVSLNYPRPQGAPPPAPKPFFIRLDYGQPHLRGRALHTDSLVPYDKAWRTGANLPTTLTTEVDIVLGGLPLASGTYVLFTLPARAGWKLIVQKSVGQSAEYDQKNDLARIDLRHAALATPVEAFTMWLIPSLQPGKASGELRFAWGTDQLATDWSLK